MIDGLGKLVGNNSWSEFRKPVFTSEEGFCQRTNLSSTTMQNGEEEISSEHQDGTEVCTNRRSGAEPSTLEDSTA